MAKLGVVAVALLLLLRRRRPRWKAGQFSVLRLLGPAIGLVLVTAIPLLLRIHATLVVGHGRRRHNIVSQWLLEGKVGPAASGA